MQLMSCKVGRDRRNLEIEVVRWCDGMVDRVGKVGLRIVGR
jgi:hypothetical protein